MRKLIVILFLAPMLMATQCEEDENFVSTNYFIQNDSSINLTYITEADTEFVIESGSRFNFNGGSNDDVLESPEDNRFITEIKLYKVDDEGNLVLAYNQDPIVDALWVLEELGMREFEYTTNVTDDALID